MKLNLLASGFALAASILSVFNFASAQTQPCPAPPKEEWLTPSRSGAQQSGSATIELVPAERIVPVPDATRDDAIRMLATTPLRRLTEGELGRLLPQSKPLGNDLIPYLARAVLANGSGKFDASVRGVELEIFNGSLGCLSLSKAPVIVFLDHEVSELTVSVESAL
jgi:hypothetical protein